MAEWRGVVTEGWVLTPPRSPCLRWATRVTGRKELQTRSDQLLLVSSFVMGNSDCSAAILVCLLVWAAPTVARACSCESALDRYNRSSWPTVSPPDGADGVPLDVVVWVEPLFEGETLGLVLDGDEVPLQPSGRTLIHALSGWADTELAEFFPEDGLEPERTYSIVLSDADGSPHERGEFTTGEFEAKGQFRAPELLTQRLTSGDLPDPLCGCPGISQARFSVSRPAPWQFASGADVDVLAGEAFLDASFTGVLETLGAPGEVRFAAMDYAGNLSDWSEPAVLEWPARGCGCSGAQLQSGRPLSSWWLTLVPWSWRRRRWPREASVGRSSSLDG